MRYLRPALEPHQPGDNRPLDVGRPRVDRPPAAIAQITLNSEFRHETVSAMHPDRIEAGLDEALAEIELGHGCLERRRPADLFQPCYFVEEEHGGFPARLHI